MVKRNIISLRPVVMTTVLFCCVRRNPMVPISLNRRSHQSTTAIFTSAFILEGRKRSPNNMMVLPRLSTRPSFSHDLSLIRAFSTSSSSSSSFSSSDDSKDENDERVSNTATTTIATGGPSAVRSQKPTNTTCTELQMLSFYHFDQLFEPVTDIRDSLFGAIQKIPGLRGTIYLASEGINAQLAVPPIHLAEFIKACQEQVVFADDDASMLFDEKDDNPPNLGVIVPIETPTFNRLIVRTRDYVLRDGINTKIHKTLDWSDAGIELKPEEWQNVLTTGKQQEEESVNNNNMQQQHQPILLDCRNDYESNEGTFENAIPLNTNTFQDSWDVLDDITKDIPRDQDLQIFCTGGIRCVKVSLCIINAPSSDAERFFCF